MYLQLRVKLSTFYLVHRILVFASVLLLMFLSTTAGFAQTIESANEAYERRDYQAAYEEFKILAEQGNAEAQFMLYSIYSLGKGVAVSGIEAFRWLIESAQQGNADALYYLGVKFDIGEGVPQDFARAFRFFLLSATQGHANAQYILGVKYDIGEGVTQNYSEAINWYRLAAEQEHPQAESKLQSLYDKIENLNQSQN